MPTDHGLKKFRWPKLKNVGLGCFLLLAGTVLGRADTVCFTNLLAQGDNFATHSNATAALKIYLQAEGQFATNTADLCILTQHFCDLMYVTSSSATKKTVAEHALNCARQAVASNPKNATAHICLAITYAKNFPFAGNQAKVDYSRGIKQESEKAIALDPKQDIAYYLLGCWHYGAANLNFFYKGLAKVIYGGLPPASNEKAIENFKAAIALNPNRIIHHAELGKVYATIGQATLARNEWEKCRKLQPLDRDDREAQQEAVQELAKLTP
ncbi:MAG TPA: hypothetical protein VGO57_10420 [Verrucomicrobiae bacterium]|jgi:tetratricopeptide (TPR) repeat protein